MNLSMKALLMLCNFESVRAASQELAFVTLLLLIMCFYIAALYFLTPLLWKQFLGWANARGLWQKQTTNNVFPLPP